MNPRPNNMESIKKALSMGISFRDILIYNGIEKASRIIADKNGDELIEWWQGENEVA